MNVVNFEPKREPNQLQCTSCGATVDAPCACGAPFKLLMPRERARIVVERNPTAKNKVLAREANVSETTIRTARKKNEPPFEPKKEEPFWTPEKDAEIMRLDKEGKGGAEIAEELGITRGAASGRMHRLRNIHPDLESRRLPPEMPDDVLEQAMLLLSTAKARMYDVDSLSVYVDQMHEDVRQLIAEEVEVVYNLSKNIIRRLVGGTRNIKAPACGVEIKLRKED
jgi:hypothetical protein